MVSLPIPANRSMHSTPPPDACCPQSHSDLEWNGRRVSDIVDSLRGHRPKINGVHLDPDLDRNLKIKGKGRPPGWKGSFGQSGPAQPVLEGGKAGEGLVPGDLFLFFGLFSQVIEHSLGVRYGSREKLNVLFGWLQIEDIKPITDKRVLREEYPWAACHPHLQDSYSGTHNTLYIAREELEIDGAKTDIPGYGTFPYFSPALQLSESGNAGSFWMMPPWCKPRGKSRSIFSSHPNGTTCWTPIYDDKDENTVKCHRIHLGPGQEFILDCEEYPESIQWALLKIRGGLSAQASTASA